MKDFKDLNILQKAIVYIFHSLPFILLLFVAYKKPAVFFVLAISFVILATEKGK